MLSNIDSLFDKVEKCKRVAITTHINPDPDALGSTLALYKFLHEKKNSEMVLDIILQDPIESALLFMFEENDLVKESIKKLEKNLKEDLKEKILLPTEDRFYDLLICLDSANIDRIGDVRIEYDCLVNIDHHESNTLYGDINLVNSSYASTCEMIFDILEYKKYSFTPFIAKSIFIGMSADTGNFSWGNITSQTFKRAAELKKSIIDYENIFKNLYYNKSEAQTRLLGYALQNFTYLEKHKFAYLFIDREILSKYDAKQNDVSGIINSMKIFKDAEIILLLTELEDSTIKGSLRSTKIDLKHIANLFNGGGHSKAVGFKSKLSSGRIFNIATKYLESEK